ncbi:MULTISPECIES: hypothetical protein [unclassified Variovorax]|uniref:hypothetical protein n=1 Tax=unclassified Variovorax TaxID=663243 RepID=UPI003F481B41
MNGSVLIGCDDMMMASTAVADKVRVDSPNIFRCSCERGAEMEACRHAIEYRHALPRRVPQGPWDRCITSPRFTPHPLWAMYAWKSTADTVVHQHLHAIGPSVGEQVVAACCRPHAPGVMTAIAA